MESDTETEIEPAVESKSSFTLPLAPDPKIKRRRRVDVDKCIICQRSQGREPLRTGKYSSVEKLISSAKQRRDEVLCDIVNSASDTGVLWHSLCYASYTSAENIRHVIKSFKSKDANTEDDDDKGNEIGIFSRSIAEVLDWSKCMFCKNKTYKKSNKCLHI